MTYDNEEAAGPSSKIKRPNNEAGTVDVLNNDRKGQSQREPKHQIGKEELVYVRLETIGTDIRDLNTRVINERLFVGVFSQLLGSHEHSASPEAVAAPAGNIRSQILEKVQAASSSNYNDPSEEEEGANSSSSNDKCRLAMEKFLCRLAYPVCHFKRSDISALVRPPCREDCLLLKDVYCSNLDWSKFALILQQAINETLASIISVSSPDRFFLETEGNRQLDDDDEGSQPSHGRQPGYNFTASVHLYWPHEHSIARCKSLPSLNGGLASHNNNNNHDKQHFKKIEAFGHTRHKKWRADERRKGFLNYHSSPENKWPICSNARLTSTAKTVTPTADSITSPTNSARQLDCLKSATGIEYAGHRNFTRSNHSCQAWASQWPHRHSR